MEQHTLDFSDYLSAFKRRRLSIIIIAATILAIGTVTSIMWPPTYKSSATILIKEQDIPPELVQSTVTSFAAQRIQAISQKVMARPNLMDIINQYRLYEDERQRLTTEEIIAEMRENIGLEMIEAAVVDPRSRQPTAATIAFQLSFRGENPNQVQKVANELMSLFLEENLKERSEKASETFAFLEDESVRLSREIKALEEKMATFKEQHVNTLPELSQLNQSLMERTEREMTEIDNQIRAQQQTKIYLQGQLAQLKPYGADMALDPATRLQALRTQYLGMLARYSSEHPDVLRMQREIEGLEQETGGVNSAASQLERVEALRGELATLRQKYSDQHPDVVKLERQIAALENSASHTARTSSLASAAADNPDNPAYIQLAAQIEAADTQIRSLEDKKQQLRDKVAEYERRLVQTPQVEREYRNLSRDLQNAIVQYQGVNTKKTAAQIAQQLEKESKGERFLIVEPPILPEEPVSPNRPAILFLSFVLALASGVGYAALAESLDDSVHSGKTLISAVGAAPLAVIPYLETDTEASKRKRQLATRAAAAAAAVILAIAMLHYFWTPLDVLWYKALRKADVVINT
jgi:succinoglycan biosynthesis transport protein ExoP